MDQVDCARVEAYLRKLFGAPKLMVSARGRGEAEITVGAETIADLVKDEEDGELSYCLSMLVPRAPGAAKGAPIDTVERARLESVLKQRLGASVLTVRPRPRKTDSAEVYAGEEFIGTLSADEDAGYFLTLIVLGIDLEGE